MKTSYKRTSKFLSLVLRHEPQKIGITLDESGWVSVDELITQLQAHGHTITKKQLDEVVRTSDKKRFAYNENKTRIRANQGHSVEVQLDYEATTPPEMLYHGTVEKFLEAIAEQGLCKMQRHHVHLSQTQVTASKVGQRRGRPIILEVYAARMHAVGHVFYVSANGVWLTEHVPPRYIHFPES